MSHVILQRSEKGQAKMAVIIQIPNFRDESERQNERERENHQQQRYYDVRNKRGNGGEIATLSDSDLSFRMS